MPEFTHKDYHYDFLSDPKKRETALNHALDIRKFEIELYWKRAAYFWTLIAAIFVGFVALQRAETAIRQELSIITAGIGFIFSIAWYCVVRGSKSWQENWEFHVDLLEDEVTGPLYKTVLQRKMAINAQDSFRNFFLESYPYSVSKVNQIVSVYVISVWFFLMLYSVDTSSIDTCIRSILILIVNLVTAYLVLRFGVSIHNEKQDDALLSAMKRNILALLNLVRSISSCSSVQKNSKSKKRKVVQITAVRRDTVLPEKYGVDDS
ncbi:hypothetical protein [Pseudovibrio ascidiaceicola]|uniref:RipA family octameric membrane protein n=1 Tax=Pseudovibrio ascidiaceicola TaxID=285279 RepID=UPI000D69E704|nr:hypothetical protein [Pseudovibrio ascidiaceicola]